VLRDFNPTFVRFGSGADISRDLGHVRFTPQSGQTGDIAECLLCANSDRTQRSK